MVVLSAMKKETQPKSGRVRDWQGDQGVLLGRRGIEQTGIKGWREAGSHANTWAESILCRGNNKCESSETRIVWDRSRTGKKSTVTGKKAGEGQSVSRQNQRENQEPCFTVQNNCFEFYSKCAGKPLEHLCKIEKYFHYLTFYYNKCQSYQKVE